MLLGIDRDPDALAIAGARLTEWSIARNPTEPFPWRVERANFNELQRVLLAAGHPRVDGLLLDLGVSSLQLDVTERGFSFRGDGPLDMRMDASSSLTAADLVNSLPEAEIARLIWEYGDERYSRRIARAICDRRPLSRTRELADLVYHSYPPAVRRGRIHPATRTFQALRIAVNEELSALTSLLEEIPDLLVPQGRLVVLSYHSLEDRIVKRSLEYLSGRCRCDPELPACACGATPLLRILTRKPVTPGPEELAANPRSRSARLRAAERL